MTQTLFISDLHLCETRPQVTRLFLDFLAQKAPHAEALFILGDLFEYWAGDDDLDDPHIAPIIAGLRALTERGMAVYLMHGNRDFLIGRDFAAATGVALLQDPWVGVLHGRAVLLTHGDQLCTDDVAYQDFRRQVRDAQWQQAFLAQPLAQRKAQIAALRQRSMAEKSAKAAEIMDVNADAVSDLLRQHGYPDLLIHGHTHRPGRHMIVVDGHAGERIVLSDWDTACSYLACDKAGCEVVPLS